MFVYFVSVVQSSNSSMLSQFASGPASLEIFGSHNAFLQLSSQWELQELQLSVEQPLGIQKSLNLQCCSIFVFRVLDLDHFFFNPSVLDHRVGVRMGRHCLGGRMWRVSFGQSVQTKIICSSGASKSLWFHTND